MFNGYARTYYNLHTKISVFLKDNCIYHKNRDQADQDNDNYGDVCDNCRNIYNPGQENLDNDAKGNVCDEDIDGDDLSKYNYSFCAITA